MRAFDRNLKREVAIKILKVRVGENQEAVARFAREARLAAAVQHPNVVRVFDQGTAGSHPFIVMELSDGRDLRCRLQQGPLPLEEALAIGSDFLAGLGAAHEAGVLHRDLKPENVLIEASGRARVTDFGIARHESGGTVLTAEGTILGTLPYTSPELLLGQPATKLSDLFAAGVVLHEMLTGHQPYTPLDLMKAAQAGGPLISLPKPDLAGHPLEVASVVAACLEGDASARPRSASRVSELLSRQLLKLQAEPSARPSGVEPGGVSGMRRAARTSGASVVSSAGRPSSGGLRTSRGPAAAKVAEQRPVPSRPGRAVAMAAGFAAVALVLLSMRGARAPKVAPSPVTSPAAPQAEAAAPCEWHTSAGGDRVVVRWRTVKPGPSSARIRSAARGGALRKIDLAGAPSTTHEVVFAGLVSGAAYELAVAGNGGRWSPDFQATTLRVVPSSSGALALAEVGGEDALVCMAAGKDRIALLTMRDDGTPVRLLASQDAGRSWASVATAEPLLLGRASAAIAFLGDDLHLVAVRDHGRGLEHWVWPAGLAQPHSESSPVTEGSALPRLLASAPYDGGIVWVGATPPSASGGPARLCAWKSEGSATPAALRPLALAGSAVRAAAAVVRERTLVVAWSVQPDDTEELFTGRLGLDGAQDWQWTVVAARAAPNARPRMALSPGGTAAALFHLPKSARVFEPGAHSTRGPAVGQTPEPTLGCSLWAPGRAWPERPAWFSDDHSSIQLCLGLAPTPRGLALVWGELEMLNPEPFILKRRDWPDATRAWSAPRRLAANARGLRDLVACQAGGALHVVARAEIGNTLLYWRFPE